MPSKAQTPKTIPTAIAARSITRLARRRPSPIEHRLLRPLVLVRVERAPVPEGGEPLEPGDDVPVRGRGGRPGPRRSGPGGGLRAVDAGEVAIGRAARRAPHRRPHGLGDDRPPRPAGRVAVAVARP